MAAFNLNKVILGGRLTHDPELKTTPSGIPVVSFSIAINRNYKGKNGETPQADFLNVTAWRQTAEFITRYFRKASSICVVGSVQTRSWTDQNGQKRVATEIVADEAYFVDSKSEMEERTGFSSASRNDGPAYVPDAYKSTAESTPKFEDLSEDQELPF